MEKKSSSKDILEELNNILDTAIYNIKASSNLDELNVEKLTYTGKKSKLIGILKSLKDFDIDTRKEIGNKANTIRINIEQLLEKQERFLIDEKINKALKEEVIDITQPGDSNYIGSIHPISQTKFIVENIFNRMGFEVFEANEVDDDYHNFQTLNMPENHPARDSWDTFWTKDGHVCVPHTSSMQNRILKSSEPPIQAIVMGRSFRNESTDPRHEHTFNQVEGICVDKGINLGHMLGTLQTFFAEFFESNIEVKFTPDFFPFVEPGGMMSLTCFLCNGEGCNVCKKSGWLEVLGCGMIHPNVLNMAGIDHNVYSGFAWGFGLERLIMLKNNIEDVRHFHSGNLKFIRQF
jgi:phenylalanyl-tRNA synthetase alpha chain